MRKKDKDINIASILEQMFKRYKLDTKQKEMKIRSEWGNIFGPMILKHTQEITLKDKTLYLKVDNAPLKNEIFLQRQTVIGKVNEYFEEVWIEKIYVSS
jgi:hypothetical protein